MFVNRIPQVRQIQAPEGTMPVRAVTLSAVQFGPGFVQCRQVFCINAGLFQALQPVADLQHPRIHLIELGVFHTEVPPESAPQIRFETIKALGLSKLFFQCCQFQLSF